MTECPKIIVALDYSDLNTAENFIGKLSPDMCCLKVGKSMFTRFGPQFVRSLVDRGFFVFLDLKFHDIPNTVADACFAAAELGVWMLNVHVMGGLSMLQAARHAIDQVPKAERPLLIGVTVLTSLEAADLQSLGIEGDLPDVVVRYADMAKQAGLDGVVCSAKEAPFLRQKLGKDFLLVTPGIRMANDHLSDQKRVVTPEVAIALGADYLVMGRSITQGKDPLSILRSIRSDIF